MKNKIMTFHWVGLDLSLKTHHRTDRSVILADRYPEGIAQR